jgi:hypothetical protein
MCFHLQIAWLAQREQEEEGERIQARAARSATDLAGAAIPMRAQAAAPPSPLERKDAVAPRSRGATAEAAQARPVVTCASLDAYAASC